ncbi:MAG TPA: hypothetical protein VFL91_02390 [Thermomicrobiales bacterium]|nr:hypothetical protein [Thermomicrobiales bacterium]
MSGYDPVTARVRPILARLQRETARGTPPTVAFAALCTALTVPADLRGRLLRRLLDAGYVTEEGGRVRLTEAGAACASPGRGTGAPR